MIRKSDDEPIGTIFAYGYCRADGYLFVSAFVEDHSRCKGYGAIAFSSFARTLFERYDLYKIYADVYEHNHTVTSQLLRSGLVCEGKFKGHRREGDARYSLFRLALYRDALEQAITKLEQRGRTK